MSFFLRALGRCGKGHGGGRENHRVRFSVHFDFDSFEFKNLLATWNLAFGNTVKTPNLPRFNSSHHNSVSHPKFDNQITPLNSVSIDCWDVLVASLNNVNNRENLWPNYFNNSNRVIPPSSKKTRRRGNSSHGESTPKRPQMFTVGEVDASIAT